MKKILVHHHLGLGDHIMCNAIVRHYAKQYDVVMLFTFTKYLETVGYMYRDLDNIRLLPIKDERWKAQFPVVNSYRLLNPDANYAKIGHDYLYHTDLPADKAFYEQVGLPWSERYDGFHIDRDPGEEQKVFEHYNPNNDPFVFVHQDSTRPPSTIDKAHIKRKDLLLVELDVNLTSPKKFNFFHYMKLMEEATESHYIDSSFKCLADSFIEDKKDMYFHRIENIKDATATREHWNHIRYWNQ